VWRVSDREDWKVDRFFLQGKTERLTVEPKARVLENPTVKPLVFQLKRRDLSVNLQEKPLSSWKPHSHGLTRKQISAVV
jgi:hypothetical protein